MTISSDIERLLKERMNAGHYGSADELLREALVALEERVRDDGTAFNEVREHLLKGVQQAERGEVEDGEEVFAEVLGAIGQAEKAASRQLGIR